MRLTALVLASVLACAAVPAWADPIEIGPPSVDPYGWTDNEARTFSLTKAGSFYTLSVEGVGSARYSDLDQCCTDVFGRVLSLYPGSTLHFTRLALNTLSIQTEFWDDLNLSLLRRAGLDNLGTLTGLVTLDVPDVVASGPKTLTFAAGMEQMRVAVPEPATWLLLGAGLVGLGRRIARRL